MVFDGVMEVHTLLTYLLHAAAQGAALGGRGGESFH